ncbi:MAG: SufD family Fe-S cluster assembly protein [Pseudomonadota bacterium]
MNAIADMKTQLAEGLLSEPAAPEAEWAKTFRAEARARFLALGAPVKRDEYWRYTDPAALTRPMGAAPAAAAPAARGGVFAGEAPALDALAEAEADPAEGALEPLHLTFVNGRLTPELSDAMTLDGVEILSLADAMAAPAARPLGRLESKGQAPVARPLAALNGALATDGLVMRVTGAPARPIHLRYLGSGAGAAHLRHVVEIAAGASLTLLESGMGAGERFNTVLEVALAEDATFHHVRSQTEAGAEAQIVTAIFAELKARAAFRSFTLRAASPQGRATARNEAMLWLEGDACSAHIAGAVLGADKAVADNTVFLTHDGVDCESRQVFKTVLADDASGVFQGKILVKQGAQKTDGYQISQSLLLSDGAEFNAKPELEIYADDVKCSHGSTTGAVDETSLFYLRARGVEEAVAQAMLVQAFVDEAIDEIEDPALQALMRREVVGWMRGRAR